MRLPRIQLAWTLAAALLVAPATFVLADEADDQFAVAAGHYAARRWELAGEEFKRFLAEHPRHAKRNKAIFFHGEALVQAGKFAAAREQFSTVLEADPDGPYARQALFRAGECAFLAEQTDEAQISLAKFREQFTDDPLNAYALSYLGEIALRAGDHTTAKVHYSEASERYADGPTADDCRLGLAQAHLGLKERRQAELVLKALIDADRRTVEAHYWLGQVFKSEERWESAAEAFCAAIAADPMRAGVQAIRYQAGESLLRAEQFRPAIDVLYGGEDTQDIQTLPNTHRYLVALAQQGLGDHDQALATLATLADAPDQELAANVLLAKATSYLALDRQRDAIGSLNEYLAESGDEDSLQRTSALAQLAVCYARESDFERAKSSLAKLAEVDPRSAIASTTTLHVAQVAAAAKQTSLANELFAAAAAVHSPDETAAQALCGMAEIAADAAELERATGIYERLLQRYPDGALAVRAALACGQLREQLEQYDAALAMYQLVIDRHSHAEQLPQALLRAANLRDRLSQEDRAIELYERLTGRFKDSELVPAAIYGWAWCLRDLKRDADASEKFEQLRRNYPGTAYWADAVYRLALFAAQAKQHDRAQALLGELIEADGTGRPQAEAVPAESLQHGIYLRAQIAIAQTKWDEAARDLERLMREHGESPLALPAAFLRADVAYRSGDMEDAGKRFAELVPRLVGRSDRWIPMVALRRAQILAQQKRWSDARAMAAMIEQDHPNFDQQFEADYLIGRAHLAEADFAQARATFQKVLQSRQGNKTETAAMAQWMIGESYFLQEQYAPAIREYLRVEVLYAFPHWQSAALLQAGKCFEQLGQWKNAGDAYGRLLKLYAQTEFAGEARERLQAVQARTAMRAKK